MPSSPSQTPKCCTTGRATDTLCRGAYCAAVLISLLNIPLELSPDSPARASGHTDLFSGLGEWVRRCECRRRLFVDASSPDS